MVHRGSVDGAVALKDCVRVLNGFGRSLEGMLPKLRDGFIAQDTETARRLAREHPRGFFLSPNGEAFHNATVTGGRVREQGPLALKRELSEVQQKLDATVAGAVAGRAGGGGAGAGLRELTAALDRKTQERSDAERESANSGAALRQMEQETARIERRLQEWALASERNRDARAQKQELIAQSQQQAAAFETEREALETNWRSCRRSWMDCVGSARRCSRLRRRLRLRWRGWKSGGGTRRRTYEQTRRMADAHGRGLRRSNSRWIRQARRR